MAAVDEARDPRDQPGSKHQASSYPAGPNQSPVRRVEVMRVEKVADTDPAGTPPDTGEIYRQLFLIKMLLSVHLDKSW